MGRALGAGPTMPPAGGRRGVGSSAQNRDTIALVKGLRKRCSSALVASALAVIPMAPAHAHAGPHGGADGLGAWAVSLAAPAREAAPAAVVGLETDAPEQGAALTKALRKAFAARGLSGGEEVNLAELRLALGCKGTSPKCLAKGGSLVGARRLIYGTLRHTGGTWSLEATLVEVDGGAATSASLVLTTAELAADRIDRVAQEVADRLAPETASATTPEPGAGGLASSPASEPVEPVEAAEPDDVESKSHGKGKGKLWWGWVKPQPRWRLAGFGLGVTFSVVGLSTVAGTGVWLTSKNGGFRGQLIDAAEASLLDANPLNDIDPNLPEGVNLCDYARDSTDPTMPDRVRNAAVARVCVKGDSIRRLEMIGAVVAGVGLATTAAFTLLLLLHRKPAPRSTWQRHGLHVGLDPVPGQGLSLRMAGRF